MPFYATELITSRYYVQNNISAFMLELYRFLNYSKCFGMSDSGFTYVVVNLKTKTKQKKICFVCLDYYYIYFCQGN